MHTAPDGQRTVARWLVAHEAGEPADTLDADALAAAGEAVCQKLCGRVTTLVTAQGAQALLARALHLARADFSLLAGVRAGTLPDTCLVGLHEALPGPDPAQASAAVAAVFAHVLSLLTTFIGGDLTARLVYDVWPDAPHSDAFPGLDVTPQEEHP